MGQAKKMDCSANGEVILGARDRRVADFYKRPFSHSLKQQPIAGLLDHPTTMIKRLRIGEIKEGPLSDRSPMERILIRSSRNLKQGAPASADKTSAKGKTYAQ